MKSYKDLDTWKKAKALVKQIYLLSGSLPQDERFGLISQLRRASISVPANIAEGIGRNHPKDTIQFLHIARGSLYEIETLVILSFELNYITEEHQDETLAEVNDCLKVLNGLIKYYETKS